MLKKFSLFNSADSYLFQDPDTKHKFVGRSLKDVAAQVASYREQNDLPPLEYLEAIIENYLCGLPSNQGKCESLKGPFKRGLFPTIKGGVLILKSVLYNSFVSQEVADERAAICIKCPLNIFPDKGPFLEWADKLAKASIGNKRSKYQELLGNCAGCSCLMKSKVWYDGKIDLKPTQKKKMLEASPTCWQVKEADK